MFGTKPDHQNHGADHDRSHGGHDHGHDHHEELAGS